jgi:hypothetical protein
MKKLFIIALTMLSTVAVSAQEKKPVKWINNVKLSGYGMLQYKGSTQKGGKSNSFDLRLARVSLDGRIFNDWYWKAQIQFNGNTATLGSSPRVVDLFVEWQKFPFLMVKAGQFKRPFTFENPKAQAKLKEYEAARGIPYEQMLCAFMQYGAGLKQEVCETRIYFETEGIHTTFCHFGKIYSFDVPYQAVVHMSLEDEKILLIQATDVGSLCFSVKETSPEQLAWIVEKAKQFDNS